MGKLLYQAGGRVLVLYSYTLKIVFLMPRLIDIGTEEKSTEKDTE